MNFSELAQRAIDFYHDYTLVSIGLGIIVLIWAFMKPKQAFKGLLFLGFIAAVFYVLSLMGEGTESSRNLKEGMIHRTEKALE